MTMIIFFMSLPESCGCENGMHTQKGVCHSNQKHEFSMTNLKVSSLLTAMLV